MKAIIKVNHSERSYSLKRVTRKVVVQRVGKPGKDGQPGLVQGIVAGENINVDSTDQAYPIVSAVVESAVDSVNGKKGVVVLNKSDIGLSNVDNTSDSSKPISTATQSALNLKANTSSLSSVATTGSYNDLSNKPTIPAQFSPIAGDNISITGSYPLLTFNATASEASVESVNGETGEVILTTDDVADTSSNRYTNDADIERLANTSNTNTGDQDLSGLVPMSRTINSKALTSNVTLNQDDVGDGTTYKRYSQTEKTKLSGIQSGATLNQADAYLLSRSNHTGTQTASTISDFSSAADARVSAAAGVSVASLVGGLIPTSQIPAAAFTTVQSADSEVEMLALDTEEGDVVVRTDERKTYMRNAGTSGTMTDFTLMDTPSDSVTSVNGQTGTVVLGKGDVGLGNVDNTSNATERAAVATLSNKTLASPVFSGSYSFGGTPTWPTFNQNTTGSAATLTTSRTFRTNLASTSTASFNGSADVTPGVTGTLTVANGGTGRATATTAYGLIAAGTTATAAQQTISPGTSGQFLKSAGSAALASFASIQLSDLSDSASVATLNGSQTLTSKTLTNPTINNYVEGVVAIGTVTTASTIDLTSGTFQTATLTASTACTFTMPTAVAGKSFILHLKQAASTGGGTATFTGVKWPTSGAPTITSSAGKMDILSFTCDGTNWYGSYAQGFTP